MNDQDAEQLTVVSFNCDGINNSAAFINDFLDSEHTDIICIQETWLLDADLSKLGRIHTGYLFSGNSGVDARERILAGRPDVDLRAVLPLHGARPCHTMCVLFILIIGVFAQSGCN